MSEVVVLIECNRKKIVLPRAQKGCKFGGCKSGARLYLGISLTVSYLGFGCDALYKSSDMIQQLTP